MPDIATLRALLAPVSARPWGQDFGVSVVSGEVAGGAVVIAVTVDDDDATLIVAAVNALPALLDVAEAAGLVFDHHNCHCPGHVAVREALDRLELPDA